MELARAIQQARQNIKRKHNELVALRAEESENLEKIFKPVTRPLEKISKIEEERKNFEIHKKEHSLKQSFDTPRYKDPFAYSEHHEEGSSQLSPEKLQDNFLETLKSDKTYLTKQYIDFLFGSKSTDTTYGPIYDDKSKNLKLGRYDFQFLANDKLKIGDEIYSATPGLFDLLFSKNPENYTENDKDLYFEILAKSRATYKSGGTHKKGTKMVKYTQFIKPGLQLYHQHKSSNLSKNNSRNSASVQNVDGSLFSSAIESTIEDPHNKTIISPPKASSSPNKEKRSGEGLKLFVNNRKIEYKYWDDPTDMLKRLELLVASKMAGNDSLDGEIASILKELKQKKFIRPIQRLKKKKNL